MKRLPANNQYHFEKGFPESNFIEVIVVMQNLLLH